MISWSHHITSLQRLADTIVGHNSTSKNHLLSAGGICTFGLSWNLNWKKSGTDVKTIPSLHFFANTMNSPDSTSNIWRRGLSIWPELNVISYKRVYGVHDLDVRANDVIRVLCHRGYCVIGHIPYQNPKHSQAQWLAPFQHQTVICNLEGLPT